MAENYTVKSSSGYIYPETARIIAPVVKDPGMKDPHDIVEYAVKQVVKKVGDGEDDYVLEDKVVEVSRVNRQEWIAKDAPDVGVMNILEKVRRSGDMSLFNQTGASIPDGIQDYTNVPESVGEALKAVQAGSNSFEGLKAIFGDTSFDELATMTPEQIAAKLSAFVAANTKKQESEENK